MKVKEIVNEMDGAISTPKQYKITKQGPEGITMVDQNDPKSSITISPDQQQNAFKPDPADPTKLTLDPNSLSKSGTATQQTTPTIGSTVNVAPAVPGAVTPTQTMGSEDRSFEEDEETDLEKIKKLSGL